MLMVGSGHRRNSMMVNLRVEDGRVMTGRVPGGAKRVGTGLSEGLT